MTNEPARTPARRSPRDRTGTLRIVGIVLALVGLMGAVALPLLTGNPHSWLPGIVILAVGLIITVAAPQVAPRR